jgi:putative ABC transport system permease protein
LPLDGEKYRSQVRRLEFFDQVIARLESVSGIEAATPVLLTPFTGLMGWDATIAAEGQGPADAAANPGLHLEAVLPNYFDTTGIRILRGRAFTDADRQNGAPVVIVSERLARRLWPGADPLGKRVNPCGADSPAPWHIVVGLAANVRYRDVLDPPPAIYFPLRQTEFPARFMLVRSALPPAAILSAGRIIVPQIDPEQQIVDVTRATEYLRAPLAAPRFRAASATALAAVALVLVGLGLYAVVAAFVAGSVREIGVRQALGASPADVRRLVATRALRLTSTGIVGGIAVAVLAARIIRTMLFDVHPFDPLTIAGVFVLIALVTVTAAYGPARRAGRIDPAVALRPE